MGSLTKFVRTKLRVAVPLSVVHQQKNSGEALTLACTASGLDDKEIYGPDGLDIDQGYFSNMKNGKATLREELVPLFCAIVGNTIYPDWRNHHLAVNLPKEVARVEREKLESLRTRREPASGLATSLAH
jgi:hypothetical protein